MGHVIKLGRAPSLDIKVTQAVIDTAIERDSSHCFIADAVRAHLNAIAARTGQQFSNVLVDLQTIRFSNVTKKERYTYLTPRSGQVRLIRFDQGEKPDPFTFRLRSGQTTIRGRSAAQNAKARAYVAARVLDAQQDEKKDVADLVAVATKRPKADLRRPVNGSSSSIPERVGGRPPPISKGLRRAFGLRAFER